jgi:hypothetical protein
LHGLFNLFHLQARKRLRKRVLGSKKQVDSFSFGDVLDGELSVIKTLRARNPQYSQNFPGKSPSERAFNAGLLGLAFSGGGIRSATFNLGVLQALAKMNMLQCFDFLSTVSGGGYIGSWLVAWVSRAGGIQNVEKCLDPALEPDDPRARPIAFLREYSNYLTPRLGLLGADTWTMVSIWMRNSFLNLCILAMGGAAVLLVPLMLFCVYQTLCQSSDAAILGRTTTGLFLLSGVFVALNLKWFDKPNDSFFTQPKWIRRLIVLPTLASAFGLSALSFRCFGRGQRLHSLAYAISSSLVDMGLLHSPMGNDRGVWDLSLVKLCLAVGALLTVYLFLIQMLAGFYGCFQLNLPASVSPFRWLRSHVSAVLLFVLYPLLAGFVAGGCAVLGLAALFSRITTARWSEWAAMNCGTILLLSILALVVTIHVGLMGRNLPDDRREWWGRLSAWFFIYTIAFAAIVTISICGPLLVSYVALTWKRKAGFLLAWVGSTVAGVLAGKSSIAGPQGRTDAPFSGKLLQVVIKVAPVVFVLGLLLVLSKGIHDILGLLTGGVGGDYWSHLSHVAQFSVQGIPISVLAFAVCSLIAILFSLTVDINEFSMHHFYKNRLVRCYLGASRPSGHRKPNPSTGFDSKDDQPLAKFLPGSYDGPLPIVNATLNLVHGDKLAWQERKAASFFWTPLFSGFEISPNGTVSGPGQNQNIESNSFRKTVDYAYPKTGIHLGTAVAVSGAAANPNMGFHSSPAAAFLMTVFDVRLGWWLGNPKHKKSWQKAGPTFGLGYLLKELLGLTNERGGFVNLSDGGHFDNLGVYELVRRRCHYIVVCDSEEDNDLGFGGLGNAIRKCREDFGVKIEIDVSQIRGEGNSKRSRSHCAVGKIKYLDPPGTEGTLVYLKSSLTGDEPQDVAEYKVHHPEFPHQSTADQWFTESQFESYRQLGYHVAEKAFETALACQVSIAADKAGFFSLLSGFWYPPSAEVAGSFTKHAAAYDLLIERIRKEPGLGKLIDSGLFPGISTLGPNALSQRNAFYFCTSLIQLMENVYLDLNLEDNLNHPDNAGWVHVFSNWTKSPVFLSAWKLSHDTYGTTFQRWCQRNFQLP